MANGKIHYGVGLDNSQLRQGAEESKNILRGIGKTAVQEGDNIDSTFKNVGKTIAGVFALQQVKEFAVQVAKVRGEFQQLEVAFKTLLGSSTKADILMSQLIKTAATTPFGMTEIAQGAKQLIAYGTASEDVNETLIRLGDIAAGLSLPIGDLAYLYGTTMVQGRLYTQDLNQFLGRGIPLMEELAKQFGVSKNEVKGLVEEGKVGFPQVQEAIWNLTNEGSKFGGLMEAQSHTITGQISNIEDAIEQMYNELGQKSEGIINVFLSGTSTVIENWETIGKTLLVVISTYGAYKAAVIAVAAAHKIAAIWGEVSAFLSLAKSVTTAKDAMILLNIATKANPIGLVLGVVAAAATAFMMFSDSADEAADAAKKAAEEQDEFNKRVSSSAGKAMSAYKQLQKEYKDCKTAHEKREWIKNSQQRFSELGIAVNSVNTAENVFVKNTQLMMEAFKKRAEASAWQARLDEEYSKLITRKLELEQTGERLVAGGVVVGSSHTTQGGNEYVNNAGQWVYTEQGAQKARAQLATTINKDPILNEIQEHINSYANKVTEVSDGLNQLFKEAGNDPKKSKKELKAEETAAEKAAKSREQQSEIDIAWNKKMEEQKVKAQEAMTQATIDAMASGSDKELAQLKLDYAKQTAQIDEEEAKMREENYNHAKAKFEASSSNKGKSFSDSHSLSDAEFNLTVDQINEITALRETADLKYANSQKTLLQKEAQDMNRFLKEYGTYQQKKLAIANDYDERIKKADTQGERKSLEAQKQKEIADVDMQAITQKIDWQGVFGNMTTILGTELKTTLSGLKKYVETDAFKGKDEASQKTIYEAIEKLEELSPTGKGTLNFNKLQQQMDALGVSVQNLQEAQNNEKQAYEDLKKAQKNYEEALKTGDATKKKAAKIELDNATTNADNMSEAYKEAST